MRPILFPLATALLAAAVAALAPAGAGAAPQIVAAVPTGGPLALACDGGACRAEISTVCLQQGRATPAPGAPYRVHGPDGNAVRVTGVTAAGATVALAAGVLDIWALRGQVAFAVSIERSFLDRHGLARVDVEVTRLAMLTPVAEAGDPEPQSASDVGRAADDRDAAGGAWTAINAEKMAMARVTGRVINGLPARGTVPKATARALWEKAAAPEAALSADALGWTRNAVEYCRDDAAGPGTFAMRRCLGRVHDRYMHDLNVRYWDAAKPRS